jgi:hypothetical protein
MRNGSGFCFDYEEDISTGLCANKSCRKRFKVASNHTPVLESTDFALNVEGSFMAHSQQFCSYKCRHIWIQENR